MRTTILQPGDAAPDLTLKTLDDRSISLADTWRGGHLTLLIFLRHLG